MTPFNLHLRAQAIVGLGALSVLINESWHFRNHQLSPMRNDSTRYHFHLMARETRHKFTSEHWKIDLYVQCLLPQPSSNDRGITAIYKSAYESTARIH